MVQGMGTGASLHGSALGAATRRCLGFPSTMMLTRHGFPPKKVPQHQNTPLPPSPGLAPHLWVLPAPPLGAPHPAPHGQALPGGPGDRHLSVPLGINQSHGPYINTAVGIKIMQRIKDVI